MNEKMSKRDIITLIVFVFVTITAGVFGYLVDQILTEQPEGNSLGMGLWLVLPFLTGIVLRIINKDLKEIGFHLNIKGNIKWYAVAFCVFPCITIICVLVAWVMGGLIVRETGLNVVFAMMLTTFLANCIKNIFEEFAWRGCLVPYLEKTGMNDWLLYLTSGLIWGLWHVTYYMYFLQDEYFTEISRPMMVVLGIILMIFWSPLFVELRRLTKSVWPCVILHSLEDAIPTMLFVTANVFQIKESYSVMLDPISGVIPNVLVLFIGLGLRNFRMKEEHNVRHKLKI